MKKILSILLSLNMFFVPAFAEYDFSDEAQAEFDRMQQQRLQSNDFSKMKHKTEIKKNEPDERTNSQTILNDYNSSKNLLVPNNTNLLVQPQLYGSVIKVPAGTSFEVTFDSGVSSGSMAKDDRLTVRLTDDLVYNNQLIAPAGSLVYGFASDAKNAGYAYGSGVIELNFNEILTPDGNVIKISTKKILMKAKSERAVKMTRDVFLGALGSMLVGAAFTALSGSDNWGRNMAIYGGLGAVGGGIHGAMQRGEEIQIPDGTTIKVTLIDELKAMPYNF